MSFNEASTVAQMIPDAVESLGRTAVKSLFPGRKNWICGFPKTLPRVAAGVAPLGLAPAPTARLNSSPGQRPGYACPQTSPALKGRPKILTPKWPVVETPLQGWARMQSPVPGALPRAAVEIAPLGRKEFAESAVSADFAQTAVENWKFRAEATIASFATVQIDGKRTFYCEIKRFEDRKEIT